MIYPFIAMKKSVFIFQNYNLIPDFSLFDNIDMPLKNTRGFFQPKFGRAD